MFFTEVSPVPTTGDTSVLMNYRQIRLETSGKWSIQNYLINVFHFYLYEFYMGYKFPHFFLHFLSELPFISKFMFRNVLHSEIFNTTLSSPFIFSSTISGNPNNDEKNLRFYLGELEFSG